MSRFAIETGYLSVEDCLAVVISAIIMTMVERYGCVGVSFRHQEESQLIDNIHRFLNTIEALDSYMWLFVTCDYKAYIDAVVNIKKSKLLANPVVSL